MTLNEANTCADLIEPSLKAAGWEFDRQVVIGPGRVNLTDELMYDESKRIVPNSLLHLGQMLALTKAKPRMKIPHSVFCRHPEARNSLTFVRQFRRMAIIASAFGVFDSQLLSAGASSCWLTLHTFLYYLQKRLRLDAAGSLDRLHEMRVVIKNHDQLAQALAEGTA